VIIPKMLINAVATGRTKTFKLDKIMSYVFEDNELDKAVKRLTSSIEMLETIIKEK